MGRKSIRREIERQRHRFEIMEAAVRVFARRGYREATIDEIAEEARFGKGTIYNYFESKEHLFTEIIKMLFDEMESFAKEAVKIRKSAREKLKHYAVRVIRFIYEKESFFRILMREVAHFEADEKERMANYIRKRSFEVMDILAGALKNAIKKGKIKNIEPRILISAFSGAMHYIAFRARVVDKSNKSPEELAELVVSIIFDGIQK